jgi:hypothetical protein
MVLRFWVSKSCTKPITQFAVYFGCPNLHQHVGTVLGPAHLLLLHHPLGDQRINRRLGKGSCDAQAGTVAGSIVDDGTAVRTDVGQKLRTEIVQAPDTEIVFPAQGL